MQERGVRRGRGSFEEEQALSQEASAPQGPLDACVKCVGPNVELACVEGACKGVTRQDGSGAPAGGWYPRQRMTLDEAIGAFTRGSAYAEFAEGTRGMIAAGRTADLTVFDGVLAADRTLLKRKTALTIVGGEIVYEARPGGAAR